MAMAAFETHAHDVLVIGAGGAGLRAAIEAADGRRETSGSSASRCSARRTRSWPRAASRRRSATSRRPTRWQIHFRDTMVGGKLLNNPRMAQLHAQEAPTASASSSAGARSSTGPATAGSSSGRSAATPTRGSPTSATGPGSR